MFVRFYSVYDVKAQAHMTPFPAQTDGAAVRAFGDEVNKAGSPFNSHSEDYSLVFIGVFNDETGNFDCSEAHPLVSADKLLIAKE